MKPVPGSKIVGREKLCNDCEGLGRDGVVEHVNIFLNILFQYTSSHIPPPYDWQMGPSLQHVRQSFGFMHSEQTCQA